MGRKAAGHADALRSYPPPGRAWAESEGEMNKLIWPDIGMAAEPGQFKTRFGPVEITGDDLAVWKQFPRAVFAIVGLSPHNSSEVVLRLGAFDITEDLELKANLLRRPHFRRQRVVRELGITGDQTDCYVAGTTRCMWYDHRNRSVWIFFSESRANGTKD